MLDMKEIKSFLTQAENYETQINSKLEELSRLEDLIYKVTTSLKLDVVSSSGNNDKLGDSVAKMAVLREEINAAIDGLVDSKREIESVINQVQNPNQLYVLTQRYLLYKTLWEISEEMNMSYRNVCYIHGDGLKAVERILKG